jgi:hypothetical protein
MVMLGSALTDPIIGIVVPTAPIPIPPIIDMVLEAC